MYLCLPLDRDQFSPGITACSPLPPLPGISVCLHGTPRLLATSMPSPYPVGSFHLHLACQRWPHKLLLIFHQGHDNG